MLDNLDLARRRDDGSIDYAHYNRRASLLRAKFTCDLLSKMICETSLFFRSLAGHHAGGSDDFVQSRTIRPAARRECRTYWPDHLVYFCVLQHGGGFATHHQPSTSRLTD
jgi:hypothetical protein